MFTGIVEATTSVLALSKTHEAAKTSLTLACPDIYKEQTKLGDSIAVNGCCLTLTETNAEALCFDVSSETLNLTNLGSLQPGNTVNLERALLATARLDGHLVTGHIDGLAKVLIIAEQAGGWLLQVEIPANLVLQVVKKGSICLDGISLTINEINELNSICRVSCMLIPTTLQLTNLQDRRPGDLLNLETDILGKYLQRFSQMALTR